MFDLGKEKINIDCPSCGTKNITTILQVANGSTIRCSCGRNIKLHDKDGSARRSISSINNSMKKLNDVFKKLGR
jgi:uncharacterized Zn finger protein